MIPWRNLKRFFYKTMKQPAYAARVFIKREQAYCSYFFSKGKACFPEAITLFLTHRCNLRCKMCGQWGEGGVTKKQDSGILKQELSLADLKEFIDGLARFKPSITLFGGEPLLFAETAELISYIKAKGMHCLMISNGSLLENFAESLVRSGLDELNLSLDGGELLHDQIRGLPGLSERIVRGLEKVNSCKLSAGKNKPLINLQCTITKYNYEYLEQLIPLAEKIKADSLTFHNLIFLNREKLEKQKSFDQALNSSSADWEGFVCEPGIDPVLLNKKKTAVLAGKHGFSLDFYPDFSSQELKDYYLNSAYLPSAQNSRCLSPWLTAYVFPDGEIRPCLNHSYSFGNIKEGKFISIWNNERAARFRNMLKANKIFPACARCTELYRY